jgi:hypothetical protein
MFNATRQKAFRGMLAKGFPHHSVQHRTGLSDFTQRRTGSLFFLA